MQAAAPSTENTFTLPAPSEPARTSRTRRSRRRTWHQRWSVRLLGLLALVLLGAAFYAWRQIDQTMGEINAISTIPPRIQDQTANQLAGTPLAIAPTPTMGGETPIPPTVEIPVYEGASPGGPVRQTAVALAALGAQSDPSVLASPTAAPAVSTSIPPTGSPVASPIVPSPTVTPTVIDGEAQAESLMAGGMTFDTGPAQTALAEAEHQRRQTPTPTDTSWIIDRTNASFQDQPTPEPERDGDDGGSIFDDVKSAAEGAAVASGLRDPSTEPMTILVMGVDARPGSAIDIGVRPDALMVLRLDPETGTCRGLAIPRDSLAELPGYGETKINHALMLGGIEYEKLVVELYLGIEIDHHALIDFTGFEELVDAVGGITITVPDDLASPAVPAGVHTIDGETALRHARYRGGPDGDFGRIQRQQEIMRGLIAAANGRNLLTEANRLLPALQDHIRTDLSIDQLVALAKLYQSHCSGDGLELDTIPGAVVYGPIIDPLFGLPLSYVVSDPKDVQAKVDALMHE